MVFLQLFIKSIFCFEKNTFPTKISNLIFFIIDTKGGFKSEGTAQRCVLPVSFPVDLLQKRNSVCTGLVSFIAF